MPGRHLKICENQSCEATCLGDWLLSGPSIPGPTLTSTGSIGLWHYPHFQPSALAFHSLLLGLCASAPAPTPQVSGPWLPVSLPARRFGCCFPGIPKLHLTFALAAWLSRSFSHVCLQRVSADFNRALSEIVDLPRDLVKPQLHCFLPPFPLGTDFPWHVMTHLFIYLSVCPPQ